MIAVIWQVQDTFGLADWLPRQAAIAQLGERQTEDLKVPSSTWVTAESGCYCCYEYRVTLAGTHDTHHCMHGCGTVAPAGLDLHTACNTAEAVVEQLNGCSAKPRDVH